MTFKGGWESVAALTITLFAAVAASAQEMIPEAALARIDFTPYWQARVPLRSGDTVLAAYLLDGTLYVTSRQGMIHVFDAANGVPVWSREVADNGRTIRAPSHFATDDGRIGVIITHAGGADIYDLESGDTLAIVTGLWAPGSAAVGDPLMLYVGSSDGHLYAVRWYDPVHRTPVVRWRLLGGGPVTATPALLGDMLYFTSQSGKVYACTADSSKSLVWRFSTEAPLDADAVFDASGVYVAGLDRSLYCLDRETGDLKWRHRLPAPLRDAPILAEGIVYQYCSQSGLVAIEAATGKPLWELPEGVTLASRRGNRTCVLLGSNRLALLESTTGLVIGTLPMDREAVVPIHREGIPIHIVTHEGEATCYAPRDMPYLRASDLRRRGTTAPAEPATQPAEAEPGPEAPPEGPKSTPESNVDDPLRSRTDG